MLSSSFKFVVVKIKVTAAKQLLKNEGSVSIERHSCCDYFEKVFTAVNRSVDCMV